MDVRIGYSVELDKVPEKVADMLGDLSLQKAGHLMEMATQMIELGHHETGLSLIEDCRVKLASIDRALNESYMILSGYATAKEQPEVEPADVVGEDDVD